MKRKERSIINQFTEKFTFDGKAYDTLTDQYRMENSTLIECEKYVRHSMVSMETLGGYKISE